MKNDRIYEMVKDSFIWVILIISNDARTNSVKSVEKLLLSFCIYVNPEPLTFFLPLFL